MDQFDEFVIPINALVEAIPPVYFEGMCGEGRVKDGEVVEMLVSIKEMVRVAWGAVCVMSGGRKLDLNEGTDRKLVIGICVLGLLAKHFGFYTGDIFETGGE